MAGNYFHDPRAFYDVTADQKLYSLDDCFNFAKKDPKFIESEYKVKQGGKQGGGGGNNSNQTKVQGGGEPKVKDKPKIQIIELNVTLCCDSCVWKVKEALDDVEGVEKVDCDQFNRKVFVKGNVKPEVVLKKVKSVREDAELVVKKKEN